jgi:hypothetical protein
MNLPKLTGSEAQIKWATEKLEILAASLTNFLAFRETAGTPKEVCAKIRAMFEGATFAAEDVITEYRSLSVVMRTDTRAEQIYTDGAMRNLVNFIKSKCAK